MVLRHQLALSETDAATIVPAQPTAVQQIHIYGHSNLLYWWPAWAFGFLFAILNAGQEQFLATAPGSQPSSALGLTYVSIILLLIIFTNVRPAGSIQLSYSSQSDLFPLRLLGSVGGTTSLD